MTRSGNGAFHAVLLAGGGGTRFWPLSRANRPKQFLALAGPEPLLVESWKRLRALTPPARTWVVAPRSLARPIARMLPELRPDRLILEPAPRDTAPAVTLATLRVAEEDPGAIVGFFPADHVVRASGAFRRSVGRAVRAASSEPVLVCLGVVPDRPATGFGYLRCDGPPAGTAALEVRQFVEKPDPATAKRFLRAGRYLWNAGMFVWRAATFRSEMERAAPSVLRSVERHLAGKKGAWGAVPRISIDYALMERATRVKAVPLRAGWDDVGSWAALPRLASARRATGGGPVLVDSPGSAVRASTRMVALVGVKDTVVVDTGDAVLVVAKDRAEDVRAVVDELRRRGRRDLL